MVAPKSLLTLLSVLAIFVAGASSAVVSKAQAQWYISGNVGGAVLVDSDATDSSGASSTTSEIRFDAGYAAAGAVGYTFQAPWGAFRLEEEISYRSNNLDTVNISSTTGGSLIFSSLGTFALGGKVSTLGFMTNGWFDFNTGSKWVPFIGGGVGGANIDLDITSVGGTATIFNQSDTVLAVQLGTGIGYRVNAKSTLSLAYRIFGTMDPKFRNGAETIEGEYMNHSIMAGVAIKF